MADARAQFCEITGASVEEAAQYLELANGNLDGAVAFFFDGALPPAQQQPTHQPAQPQPKPVVAQPPQANPTPTPTPGNQPGSRPTPGGHNQPNTFANYQGDAQKVQKDRTDVEEIFRKAQEGGAVGFDINNMPKEDAFTGTMHKLGEQTTRSEKIVQESKIPKRSVITFWQGGVFTVNDGPPRKVDDPANKAFIEAINNQRVPRELIPPGWNGQDELDVELVEKKEEWKPPPKDIKAFDGQAQKMGAAPSSNSAISRPKALILDPAVPAKAIKVRFFDGVQQVVKVNENHTVDDLRCHLESVKPCGKPFILNVGGNTLSNLGQTLKDAGAIGALVQQSF